MYKAKTKRFTRLAVAFSMLLVAVGAFSWHAVTNAEEVGRAELRLDGGSISPFVDTISCEFGSNSYCNAQLPTQKPTKSGYTFLGWHPNDMSDETFVFQPGEWVEIQKGDPNHVLTAQWQLSAELGRAELRLDGGSISPFVDTISCEFGSNSYCNAQLPTQKPTKSGYTFLGWHPNDMSDETFVFQPGEWVEIQKGDPNRVLTAQWGEWSFTVNYDPNGGTVSPTSQNCVPLSDKPTSCKLTMPTPTKNGFSFAGWKDPIHSSYIYSAGQEVTFSAGSYTDLSEITLVAQWEDDEEEDSFRGVVNYDLNGGKWSEQLSQTCDSEPGQYQCYITIPETTPTQSGKTFIEWKNNTDGTTWRPGEKLDMQPRHTNFTLVAQWGTKYDVTNKGEDFDLTDPEGGVNIVINAPQDKFESLTIDGETVDGSNYTVTGDENTTVITVKNEFIKGLGDGEHAFRANFTDGLAEGSFSISGNSGIIEEDGPDDPDDPDDPSGEDTEGDEGAEGGEGDPSIPKTGVSSKMFDGANGSIFAVIALAVIAAAGYFAKRAKIMSK